MMDQQLEESLELGEVSLAIEYDGQQETVGTEESVGKEEQLLEEGDYDEMVCSSTVMAHEEVQQQPEYSMKLELGQAPTEESSGGYILPDESPKPFMVTQQRVSQPMLAPALQTFRIAPANPSRPVSIAPKPVSLLASNTVKKISVGGLQSRAATVIGSDGRPVVVLPSAGRIKLVAAGGTAGAGVGAVGGQFIRSSTGQLLQLRQGSGHNLTKIAFTQGGEVSGQKTAPRYLSIQQAQEMGLFNNSKQVVSVSPGKQVPVRQSFTSIRSPTKILPAPAQGENIGKIMLAPNPQSIVLRPAGKNTQLLKVEGTGTPGQTLLSGHKLNPQQIHEINIPGKGVQYVRLVSAGGQPLQQVHHVSPISKPAPLRLLSTTTTTKPQHHILPKTFLITDMQANNILQMVSKGQTLIPTTTLTSPQKNVGSKPQGKLVQPTASAFTFRLPKTQSVTCIATPVTSSVGPTQAQPVREQEQQQKEEQDEQEELGQEGEQQEDEMMEEEESGDQEMLDESLQFQQEEAASQESQDTKHVVLLPATFMQHNNANKSIAIAANVEIKQEITDYSSKNVENSLEFGLRPRKPCNCSKSQCLKLYCDCFANGEFCNQCNCNNCFNNLENEEYRQKAIRSCLERNPNAFRPKIGKAKSNIGPDPIRRHNKGCNCKRSGCLKNYCECFEGKIACSANCKCVGCRNIEDSLDKKSLRARTDSVVGLVGAEGQGEARHPTPPQQSNNSLYSTHNKQPCSIMTFDVIDAVCQCLLAQAGSSQKAGALDSPGDSCGIRLVLEEFAHCLQDIINTAQQTTK